MNNINLLNQLNLSVKDPVTVQ